MTLVRILEIIVPTVTAFAGGLTGVVTLLTSIKQLQQTNVAADRAGVAQPKGPNTNRLALELAVELAATRTELDNLLGRGDGPR